MIQKTEQEIMKNWGDYDTSLLSVCCITFNHEKYIAQALDSFLMQETDFPFEIIVRDDCSPDKTAEIIKKYEEKFPNIIKPIYEIENQYSKGKKASPAVYKKAVGKYFALCEGDDFWTDPLKLKKQVSFLENNSEYSGCFHDATVLIEDNEKENHLRIGDRKIDIDVDLSSIIKENNIATASIVYRNNLQELPRYRVETTKGDYALMVMIASKGLIKYMPGNMSTYRVHSGGVWSSQNKLYHEIEAYKFYILLKEHFKSNSEVSKTISYKLKLIYYNLSIEYARDKIFLKSLYYILLSLSFKKIKNKKYKKYLKELVKSIIR